VVVWKRYVTSTQLRYVHECLLRLLQVHRLSKVLGDDSALPVIHEDDRRWILEDWMPRAVALGLSAAASKASNAYFGRLAVADVQRNAPAGVQLRTFDDLEEARRWLSALPGRGQSAT
jgi:hypothetical protein